MNKDLAKAIQILEAGGVVIYPTDTAFGIGCRIDCKSAVDRVFEMRRRPRTLPMPVLVSSSDMALPYFTKPPFIVRRLMEQHWPGALTIVYTCNQKRIYSPIRAGGRTVGIRMPDHEIALQCITGVGVPILGPSANFHGDPTPYRFEDLNSDLVKAVDYTLFGFCKTKRASTVVDCTTQPPTIVRQGAVKPVL